MSLPFIPKFKYRDIIYNTTTHEVRIVMHACVQNNEPGYCVDYLNGECAWIDLSDEDNWHKIAEVTNDVKPWIKNDNDTKPSIENNTDDLKEITVLRMTDNSGIDSVSAYRTRNQCLNQVREEFKISNENFDKETEDKYIKELDENEFIETGKMKYRIDVCYI